MKNFGILDFETNLPTLRMTNEMMARLADVDPATLIDYTGIKEKPLADGIDEIFDLAFVAADNLLKRNPNSIKDIQLVISGTGHPDRKLCWSPAASAIKRLKLDGTYGFDVSHGCNSLLASIELARNWLQSADENATALILVADRSSEIVDYKDPNHRCIFSFADGSAAVLVKNSGAVFQHLGSSFSTVARLADSQYLLRESKIIWMKDDAEEDRDLIQTYRTEYVRHIQNVLKIANHNSRTYHLMMNQGDRKLGNYLEKILDPQPISVQRTFETFGHSGNSDVLIGLKNYLKHRQSGDIVVTASSATGYSFGAMSFRVN